MRGEGGGGRRGGEGRGEEGRGKVYFVLGMHCIIGTTIAWLVCIVLNLCVVPTQACVAILYMQIYIYIIMFYTTSEWGSMDLTRPLYLTYSQ